MYSDSTTAAMSTAPNGALPSNSHGKVMARPHVYKGTGLKAYAVLEICSGDSKPKCSQNVDSFELFHAASLLPPKPVEGVERRK
jgi:hypothetical protein